MVLSQSALVVCVVAGLIAMQTIPRSAFPDAPPAVARSVVRLTSVHCGIDRANYSASGFLYRSDQEIGILTALHAVAGCEELRARSVEFFVNDLVLAKLDIEHDIAWLQSPSGTLQSLVGIAPLAPATLTTNDLRVVGFPRGVSTPLVHAVPLQPQRHALLQSLFPTSEPDWLALKARQSPSVSLPVLSLAGALQPGHSGAPIIDRDDHVVGMADGGLREGTAQVGWAIDISSIKLDERSRVETSLQQLAGKPLPKGPFGLEESLETGDDRHDLQRTLSAAVAKVRGASGCSSSDRECLMRGRYADNLSAQNGELQHLISDVAQRFNSSDWLQTGYSADHTTEQILNFYKQRVAEAWALLNRAGELASSLDPQLSIAVGLLRTRLFDAFYGYPSTRPSGGCSEISLGTTGGMCMPLDRSVRERARHTIKQAAEALSIRLGVDP
jgi:hypothetical protein